MKLYELYEMVSDSQNIKLMKHTVSEVGGIYKNLGIYDGKNSIDECYNDCDIDRIESRNGWLIVWVESEFFETDATLESIIEDLHNIGGCGADADTWADGWDKAIDEAIRIVDNYR